MDEIPPCPYSDPTEFLQQGDIFRLDVVTPVVDTNKRIFRGADGRHGSVVFDEGVEATVFEHEELLALLGSCERTPLHTDPFHETEDGHSELVVVHSQLRTHFVIATQTCDICGIDRKPLPAAIILPIVTVREICKSVRLPIDQDEGEITIQSYLEKNTDATSIKETHDDFSYPVLLRKVLSDWMPAHSKQKIIKSRIQNYLTNHKEWMYLLQMDAARQIPESYIDFSVAHTIPTHRLIELKDRRVAQIADPYRSDFAQKFAIRLSRIALPAPMKSEKF